jgi:thioredoxin reductase (NADPH)
VRFTLLSRSYCHLCDEMLEALRPVAAGAPVDVIDVDAPEHAALEARWGDAVPVLFAGEPAPGHELCRYRLDAARVVAALNAALAGPDPIR